MVADDPAAQLSGR